MVIFFLKVQIVFVGLKIKNLLKLILLWKHN